MTDNANDKRERAGKGRWEPTLEDPLGRSQPSPKRERSADMTREREHTDVSDGSRENDRDIDQMRQYYQDRERDRDREDRRRSSGTITRLLTIIVVLLAGLLILVALIGMGGLFVGADDTAGSDEGFAGDVDTGSETVDVFVETVVEVVVEVVVEPAMEFVVYIEQLIVEWINVVVENI
jgi:hypothetical protein